MFFVYSPNSMTYTRLLFFKMQVFRGHVNSWFILYRSAKVALKLVPKLGRDKQSKIYLQFAVFLPLLPLIYIFRIFYVYILVYRISNIFRTVDHVKWNRMPFEF